MIGQTVSHYKILAKLGEGGMGVVYKAQDTKLKRTVALKFLPRDLMIDSEAKRKFYKEAQAAASIVHPHVCTIYEVKEVYSKTFIVMEYLTGQSLKEMIKSGPIGIDKTLKYIIQVAEGIQKAHEKGIIHRDIKSANIIITEEGTAKILDFGLAKFKKQTQTTKDGIIKGTIDYMSPEQTLGEKLDHRTDIWSLGVVLYEMLVGQVPFRGSYEQAIMYSIMNEEPEPITALRTGVPMELERIINKTMAKEPHERYQHLDDLIVDMERVKKLPSPKPSSPKKTGIFKALDRLVKPIRVPVIFLVMAFMVIGGYLIFKGIQKDIFPGSTTPIHKRIKNKIVILPFNNLTGDSRYDNWKTGIQQCMITDLYQSKYINVLSSSVLIGVLSKLNLLSNEHYTDKDLKKIASRSQATEILQGNLTKSGDSIRINVAIQEIKSMEIKDTVKAEGTGDASFHAMIDELTPKIKAMFDLSEQQLADDIDQNAAQISSSPEALHYYHQGLELYEKRKYEESNRIFEKALEIDPGFALAYYRMTINYEYLELHDQAKEYLKKALKLSNRVTVRERYLIQAHAHHLFDDSYEKQIKTLKTLLQFYPEDDTGNGMLGAVYRNMEEWNLAVEQFKKILDKDPETVYENYAYIYMLQGLYEKAKKILQDNQKLFSNKAFYSYFLSHIFLCQRKFKLALSEGEKAFHLEPENSSYSAHIGNIYFLKGNFSEAEMIYIQMLEKKNPLPQYLGRLNMSYLYLIQGKYKQCKQEVNLAIDNLKKLKQKRIELKHILYLAYLNLQSKHFSRALSVTNQALEMAAETESKWDRIFALYFQGIAYLYLEKVDRADEIAEQVKKLTEEIGKRKILRYFYHLKGKIYQEQGLISQSIDCFEKAILLFPDQGLDLNDQAFYLDSLAAAQYQSWDLEKAKENYKEIISLTSGRLKWGDIYVKSFYWLGKIFQQQNEKENAIKNYKKFLRLWEHADPGIQETEDAMKQLIHLGKEGDK
jgi:serine/threonine protein kinase/Flp pilus assembly protein TadD